jgi:putative transposase
MGRELTSVSASAVPAGLEDSTRPTKHGSSDAQLPSLVRPGGAYFFTVVTHRRRPVLTTDLGRDCLRCALTAERARAPFDLFAVVLLPDHLHAIWMLPDGDADYSTRWRRIKDRFTRAYLRGGGTEVAVSRNRRRHQERGMWQPRFWEHVVRDEDDLKRCTDYVHWNPVKHGLVERVRDYEWSSFSRFVELWEYDPDWGLGFVCPDIPGSEWE